MEYNTSEIQMSREKWKKVLDTHLLILYLKSICKAIVKWRWRKGDVKLGTVLWGYSFEMSRNSSGEAM